MTARAHLRNTVVGVVVAVIVIVIIVVHHHHHRRSRLDEGRVSLLALRPGPSPPCLLRLVCKNAYRAAAAVRALRDVDV